LKRMMLCWFVVAGFSCAPSTLEQTEDVDPAPARVKPMETAHDAPTQQLDTSHVREALSRSRLGLASEQRFDGLRQIDLRGRFHHAHVAVKGADGRAKVECVNQPRALDAMMGPAQVTP